MEFLDKIGQTAGEIVTNTHFDNSDVFRDGFMLTGPLARKGYDWWWHSFTAHNEKTGEEKAFFIEFFCINPELGGKKAVFGQIPGNHEAGILPSYMMIKAGCWGENAVQLHRFFPWDEVNIGEQIPFQVSAGNCFLSETRTLGKVEVSEEDVKAHPEWMCDAGRMVWDLTIDKKIAFNVGYGAAYMPRALEAFDMFWHAEGMKTAFEGKIYFNDETFVVDKDTCYGYADKNWGKDFTSPWVWLSSNRLKSKKTGEWLKNSAFDIGGGRPKVGGFALDKILLGAFDYEGEMYEYNFSKFWTLTKTKFKCKETKDSVIWRVEQETPVSRMETDITCLKKDMILINYEAPDGVKRHNNLWNGGNGTGEVKLYKKTLETKSDSSKGKWKWELVDEIEVYSCGCEYGEYDKSEEKQNKKKEKKNKKDK